MDLSSGERIELKYAFDYYYMDDHWGMNAYEFTWGESIEE